MLIYQNRHQLILSFLTLICFDMFWSTDTTQQNSEAARMSAKYWIKFQPKRGRSDEPLYCMISVPMWRFSNFPRIYSHRASPSSRQFDAKTTLDNRWYVSFEITWKNTSIPPFVLSLMAITKTITKTLTKRHPFSSHFSFRFVINMSSSEWYTNKEWFYGFLILYTLVLYIKTAIICNFIRQKWEKNAIEITKILLAKMRWHPHPNDCTDSNNSGSTYFIYYPWTISGVSRPLIGMLSYQISNCFQDS
jgi:hypothetical protein